MAVPFVIIFHYTKYFFFHFLVSETIGGDSFQKMHLQPLWPEEKCFMQRHCFFCIEYDGWYDRIAVADGQSKSAIMKFFHGFTSPVAGAFRVDAHMNPFLKDVFHFIITFFTAFFIFPVNKYCAFHIIKSEQGNAGKTGFGDRFIGPGNEW